jgi:hypothetical protein
MPFLICDGPVYMSPLDEYLPPSLERPDQNHRLFVLS